MNQEPGGKRTAVVKNDTSASAQGTMPTAILLVSPIEDNCISLKHILGQSTWVIQGANTYREAEQIMRNNSPPVVICERELLDGDWHRLSDTAMSLNRPPRLLVISSRTDRRPWFEAPTFGAFDVLMKPFDEEDVNWTVNSAWQDWERQHKRG